MGVVRQEQVAVDSAGGAGEVPFTQARGKCSWACIRLWAEMILLFVGVPGCLFFVRSSLRGLVVPMIIFAALICWLVLRRTESFERRKLLNFSFFGAHLYRSLRILLPMGLIISAFSYWYVPDMFLAFPERSLVFWGIVMFCYPVLSAYPQELIYRAFFMERYGSLFASDWQRVLVSALFFGWAHAFLGNWIAPLFTAAGGILFARTYLRSGSLVQCALEHGLWGDLLFTVGIGWFFYAGSIS